jgi:DNA-binding response OmpR family regulator
MLDEKFRILIVEDNRDLVQVLVESFTERDYEVEYAYDGHERGNMPASFWI